MSMSENKAAQFQLHGSRLTSTFATPRLPLEPIPPTPSFFFSSFSCSRIKVPLFQFALQPLSFTLCTPTCRKKLEFQVKGCDLKHLRFFSFSSFFVEEGKWIFFQKHGLGTLGEVKILRLLLHSVLSDFCMSLLFSPTSTAVVSPISPDVFPKGVRDFKHLTVGTQGGLLYWPVAYLVLVS